MNALCIQPIYGHSVGRSFLGGRGTNTVQPLKVDKKESQASKILF